MRLHYYESRTLCAVLEEMRKCFETRNFSSLLGLIEEAQSMGNRMEAGLDQKHSLEEWDATWRKKKKELKALEKQIEELKEKLPEDQESGKE